MKRCLEAPYFPMYNKSMSSQNSASRAPDQPRKPDLLDLVRATMSDLQKGGSKGPAAPKTQPRRDRMGTIPPRPQINGTLSNRAAVGNVTVLRPSRDEKTGNYHLQPRAVVVTLDVAARVNPTKKSTHVKLARADRVFSRKNGVGPGSSRSITLDRIRAIAAAETGCKVRPERLPELPKHMKATTSRGDGNVMGGRQYLR